jgi:excisionase family DNA binding protein
MKTQIPSGVASVPPHYTTREVASLLDMAVRSVQLMVDRGELQAWKTAGGHRRIARDSVNQWLRTHASIPAGMEPGAVLPAGQPLRALLIEDSVHYQNLVRLLMQQQVPEVQLHVANDGITGLAMYGQLQPEILIVDILLPGIDGATLITTLRSRPQFARSKLLVITSLDVHEREPYAFALEGVTVVHKPRLVAELPQVLHACLAEGSIP